MLLIAMMMMVMIGREGKIKRVKRVQRGKKGRNGGNSEKNIQIKMRNKQRQKIGSRKCRKRNTRTKSRMNKERETKIHRYIAFPRQEQERQRGREV